MLARALAKHLDATFPSLTFGTGGNVFLNLMPSSPEVAVAIYPTGGFPQLTKEPDDLPTIQIRVRGPRNVQSGGWDMAQDIYSALACLDGVTLDPGGPDETYLVGLTPMQSAPVSMGLDPNQRAEWSLNFAAHEHAPTANRS